MPIDQLTVLLQADFGAWGREDLERVSAVLGWRLGPAAADQPTDVVGGEPFEVKAFPRASWDHRGWYGEYTSLRSRLGNVPAPDHADVHRAALDDVVKVLGPPALIGGPGAWARWLLPSTIVELSAADPLGRVDHGRTALTLEVMPRQATENDEYQRAEAGEDGAPPYAWRARAPHGSPVERTLGGLATIPRRPAADWDELERNLRETFAALVVDLPVLRRYAWGLTWTISPSDGKLAGVWEHVQGTFGRRLKADLPIELADRVATVETAKKWRRPAEPGGPHGSEFRNPTAQDGLRIAEFAMAEIRSWGLSGPEQLSYQAWTEDSYVLDQLGFGLGEDRR